MTLSYTLRTRESTVGESLKKCAPLVERVGQGEWNFILNNGSMLLVNARADEHWLQLGAPVRAADAQMQGAWQLLSLNRDLSGLSKVALTAGAVGQPGLHVRAEIPLDEEVDLRTRLKEACFGLKAAASRLHGEPKALQSRAGSKADLAEKHQSDSAGLRKLCEESGWKFTERSGSKLAVDLEARNGFYQAIVEQRPGGGVSMAVELTSDTALGENSKQAIGTLLLRASALIRLARAVVKEEDEAATANFEVFFQTAPCAAELSHALSALAVASGLCGPAVEAIREEVVATNYLTSQALSKSKR